MFILIIQIYKIFLKNYKKSVITNCKSVKEYLQFVIKQFLTGGSKSNIFTKKNIILHKIKIKKDIIMPNYNPINTLVIGLGNPIEYSPIKINDVVLHLGCGFGDDTFVIRRIVGDSGRIIAIDYNIDNIAISRQNCGNFGFSNVTFFVREIDKLLFEDNSFDAVVCNYAINLMSNRDSVLNEIYRVLQPNGKLIISDFLINKTLPKHFNNTICNKYQQMAKFELANYPTILMDEEYNNLLLKNNFADIQINIERTINIDDGELLLYIDYTNIDEWNKFGINLNKIVSISIKNL